MNNNDKNDRAARSKSGKAKNIVPTIIALAAGVFLIISVIISVSNFRDRNAKKLEGFQETYGGAYAQAHDNVYNGFYDAAYADSEKRHHISNEVLISVGDLRKNAELEVLEVVASDIKEYTFDNEFSGAARVVSAFIGKEIQAEGVAWLEGMCGGVFSVDLNAAEIVIDDENKYVLVRIPSPTLEFTTTSFEVKHLSNGTVNDNIFNGSTKFGLEEAMNDTADMTAHLHDVLNENHSYREIARSSAQTMIINMIKSVNPDIPDLEVEVKFFS